jgi:hypothetical protein
MNSNTYRHAVASLGKDTAQGGKVTRVAATAGIGFGRAVLKNMSVDSGSIRRSCCHCSLPVQQED